MHQDDVDSDLLQPKYRALATMGQKIEPKHIKDFLEHENIRNADYDTTIKHTFIWMPQ
jgi:hypothetical protein